MFMGALWLVFMHYDGAFFLGCCLWCFVISLCFWYKNGVNDKIISKTYLERRRQTRFPTFATEGRKWMARYESLAELFGYTSVKMMEELQGVLEGQAFNG
ncbi:hypothetical protein BC941DRAFT_471742 [Chlamydoabsidia padenii]|nr:hypothetical protein BC941DRAFT_471742 [Chlamydoabsidia padenii]